MIKKGILLAGGTGSRLSPITKGVNKQLLPISDRPLFFYPLSILFLAEIKDILIIVNKGQIKNFKNILGNGKKYGVKIKYKEQNNPRGIPEAFKIGKEFIRKDNVALILGDNFFYGQSLSNQLLKSRTFRDGCLIYTKEVSNPENFGICIYNKKKQIINLIEKPKKKISNKAVTGLYYFDNSVVNLVKKLKPSKRGETEIVDLLKIYLKNKKLKSETIGKGAIWSDAGKIEEFISINNFVSSVEKVQNFKIGCLDEISYNKGWIDKKQIIKNIKFYGSCAYSDYLKKL